MKTLLNNETVKDVLRMVSFVAVIWFIVALVGMLVTIKAWSEFATADFIFGMIFVINAGFLSAVIYLSHRLQVSESEATKLENKVTVLKNIAMKQQERINSLEATFKKATLQPATNEPPTAPLESYTDSFIQAEVEAAKERDMALDLPPPDDDPIWQQPWQQPENEK